MTENSGESRSFSEGRVLRTALLVGVVIALALLAWKLTHVLLLAFAAVMVAIVLRSLAGLFERIGPLKSPWSVLLAALAVTLLLGGFVAVLGAQVQTQISSLLEHFPDRLNELGGRIGVSDLYGKLSERAEDAGGSAGIVGQAAGYAIAVLDVAATLLVVVVAGVFMALKPEAHFQGALQLLPRGPRQPAETAFRKGGRALRLWLLGQLVSMAMVGLLTTVGLTVIGVPSALGLGFLAAIFEFVPIFGPLAAAVPGILLALSEGGRTALWTVALYVGIQQLEGNLIQPLIQRRAVHLPPVLMLFSIVTFGILFGTLGVLLATPLAVLAYVLVKQLYLRDRLKEDVGVPGED